MRFKDTNDSSILQVLIRILRDPAIADFIQSHQLDRYVKKMCTTQQSQYQELLNQKLLEEVKEFLDSGNSEEIADILEVLLAILANRDLCWQDIEKLAEQKRLERGAFEKRIVLVRAEL